jgi:hypothetical protein
MFVRLHDASYEFYVISVDAQCVTPVSMKVIAGELCFGAKKTAVA